MTKQVTSKKGRLTREMIVEKAAELFNTVGYYRASITDVMEATGMEKGGIYNHFQSKDELAVAAFDYAIKTFGGKIQAAVARKESAIDKLLAFVDAFNSIVQNPPIPGGCPLLNCAVENDDGNPILKDRARLALEKLLGFVESLVADAEAVNAIKKKESPRQIATFIVSSLEGGIMLSRLHDDNRKMEFVAESLKSYLLDLKN